MSGKALNHLLSNSAALIIVALLSSSSTRHHGVHAGRALPSSFTGTRGGAAVSSASGSAYSSVATASNNGGWSILNTIRSLKEENKDQKDKDDEEDLGDDCWGWQDDWTDDEYEACWDGTFKYELDPSGPPDRCDKYDPGDNTDDWTDVCAEWYAKFGECAEDGQEAESCESKDAPFPMCCAGHVCADDDSGQCVPYCGKEDDEAKACGSDDDDAPEECCGDLICGDDNKCVALPACAAPDTKAVRCGAADGLFAKECCDGLTCSTDGSDTCVVPPPPVDTDPPTQAPVRSPIKTASPTASPTTESAVTTTVTVPDEMNDQMLIPFLTYALELVIPNPSRNRRRAQQNRALVSFDEDELERLTAERVHQALSTLGDTYSSSDVDMDRVGEYVKFDFTVVVYSLTGLARFTGSDITSLPSREDVDAAILNAFEGDEYVSSLKASFDPSIASVAGATVQEMDESPSSPLLSESSEPKTQSENGSKSIPVGVVAGVAAAVCALGLALAIGIYRSKKKKAEMKSKPYASSASPLSKQVVEFDSHSRTHDISDDAHNHDESDRSEGSSRFSGLGEKESLASTDGFDQASNFSNPRDTISLGADTGSQVAPSLMGDASVTYSIDPSHMSGEDQSMASGSAGQMSALGEEHSTNVGSTTGGAFREAWKDEEGMSEMEEDEALQFHRNADPKSPGSALSGYSSALSGESELIGYDRTQID